MAAKKKCNKCGKSFKSLATHIRMKHEGGAEKLLGARVNIDPNAADEGPVHPPFLGEVGRIDQLANMESPDGRLIHNLRGTYLKNYRRQHGYAKGEPWREV